VPSPLSLHCRHRRRARIAPPRRLPPVRTPTATHRAAIADTLSAAPARTRRPSRVPTLLDADAGRPPPVPTVPAAP
jgi:hypothetical protein